MGDRPISPIKCQAEKRSLAIVISLLHEFESEMLNERFLWNTWK